MKGSSMASKLCSLVCPLCEAGELNPLGHDQARCDSCRGSISGAMLEALRQIATLQDAVGSHACECGHPEMRVLPDGVFLPGLRLRGTSARGLEGQEREGSSGRKMSAMNAPWMNTTGSPDPRALILQLRPVKTRPFQRCLPLGTPATSGSAAEACSSASFYTELYLQPPMVAWVFTGPSLFL